MKCTSLVLAVVFLVSPAFGADNELTEQEKKEGWILLFDGQSLAGWMTSSQKPSKRPVE